MNAIALELLESLEGIMQGCGFCDCRPHMGCLCSKCVQAKAAIAKARGEA